MKKRVLFILFGAFFLVAGVSGLVLVQSDLFYRPAAEKLTARIEPVPPPGTSGLPEQAGTESNAAPDVRPGTGAEEQAGSVPPATGPASGGQVLTSPAEQAAPQPQPGSEPKTIPPVLKGPRRFPVQEAPAQAKPGAVRTARPRPAPAPSAAPSRTYVPPGTTDKSPQPVVLRFPYNPAGERDIAVARVHLGDRIVIKVRRIGGADRRIYLGFDLPGRTAERSSPYGERVVRKSRAIITPVKDSDQLVLKAEGRFGPTLSSRLDSREGAVLKLGSRAAQDSYDRERPPARESGYYDIRMTIYPGNRWNIKPRSLL